jgi:hypothetical protein
MNPKNTPDADILASHKALAKLGWEKPGKG